MSKKANLKEKPSSELNINYYPIKESSESLNPCLAVFPLNYPSLEVINSPTETQWKLGQNRDRKLSSDKSILGINSRIIYESRNKPMQNRNQYILGVLNKKTKRDLDLYEDMVKDNVPTEYETKFVKIGKTIYRGVFNKN